MNALKLLKKDHSTLKSLFNKFGRAGRTSYEKRAELFDQIRKVLQLHTRVEEEIFYPAIKAHNGDGRRLVSEALKQHRHVDELLTQLVRLKVGAESFNEKMEALFENIDHHVYEEEGEIFQFAEENCSESELEEIGVELERRKKTLEEQMAA